MEWNGWPALHAPGSRADASLDELIDALSEHVDVVRTRLFEEEDVVQIQPGPRPVFYVNAGDTPEEQTYGIMEAIRVLVLGWENVASAHLVRHLRPVT